MRPHLRRPSLAMVIACLALLVAGFSSSLGFASGQKPPPGSQWASVAMIRKDLVGQPMTFFVCSQSNCYFDDLGPHGFVPEYVQVVKAKIRGLGRARKIRGVLRYQYFGVRACAVDYALGAVHVNSHFKWYTRHPSQKVMTTNADGTISGFEDSGNPYGVDWNHPISEPLSHPGWLGC